MTAANDKRRRAKLRSVAEAHGLELAGISTILWPKTAGQLELLRQAWLEVEADAERGVLAGELRFANYRDGRRPRAWWLWTRPDLERSDTEAGEAALLHAAGELAPAEIADLGVIA
jgi:hypothetical protein